MRSAQEKMLIIFNASLLITVKFRAMKILSVPVTTKITECNTKASKKRNSVQGVDISHV